LLEDVAGFIITPVVDDVVQEISSRALEVEVSNGNKKRELSHLEQVAAY
jgi:hypothetical protein